MTTTWLGFYVGRGISDNPEKCMILGEPDGTSVEIDLTEDQKYLLNIITQIDGVGLILTAYARAGAKYGALAVLQNSSQE